MSPAVASELLVGRAVASELLVARAVAADAIAASPLVKAVTLSKHPIDYWRLDDPAGNAPAPPYQLLNPSFEAGSVANWNASAGFVAAQDQVHAGAWSAKVAGAVGYNHMHQKPTLPIGIYRFSAWIMTDSAFTHSVGAGLQIEGSPNGTAHLTMLGSPLQVPAGASPWTLYILDFEVTIAGTCNLLVTNSYGGTSTGTMWVDDLSFSAGDSAADLGSNGFAGSLTNTGITHQPAAGLPGDPADGALGFNSTTGMVVVTEDASLRQNGSFSVGGRFNPTATGPAQFPTLITKGPGNGAGLGWLLYMRTGGSGPNFTPNGFSYKRDNVEKGGNNGLFLPVAGAWNFILATYDTVNLRVYLNGVLALTAAIAYAVNTDLSPLLIGRSSSAGNAFSGQLKDWSLYNYALTASDAADLYNVGARAVGALAIASEREL